MNKTVLFVASENDALPGGKVGGIADVVRDLSRAMAAIGWRVIVIMPGYGSLNKAENFVASEQLTARFMGSWASGKLYRYCDDFGVEQLLVDHPKITHGVPGQIYFDDGANAPFATDATRFSLFSAFVAEWLLTQDEIDVVHLHDWHAAPILLLKHFDNRFEGLARKRFVFTIHNLALQGVRPLAHNASSLEAWFPGLIVDDQVTDPRWPDCVNLMRAGLLLADAVNTVSPTYASEVTQPDNPERGFFGGSGLHKDLNGLVNKGALTGILNGCEYPEKVLGDELEFTALTNRMRSVVLRQVAAQSQVSSANFIALSNVERLMDAPGKVLVTSIGRLTDQKMGLLQYPVDGQPVLDHLLQFLADDGVMIMVGSGDPKIEAWLRDTAARYPNLIFVNGYADALANDLYRSGHLFLMPSSFEPCGISQMLAMRAGQPCLVHAVGGLADTIVHGKNGWSFSGATQDQKAKNLLKAFASCTSKAKNKTEAYKRICYRAAQSRFTWSESARQYELMYAGAPAAVPKPASEPV